MDELIKKIINIEEQAHGICEDARSLEKGLQEYLDNETSNMRTTIMNKATNRIFELQKFEDERTEKEILTINKQSEKQLLKLQTMFEQKSQVWENVLTSRIIGG